jgi:hypothetical protein
MTTDSKNYSGPGAAGAVPLPGRNAAGVPQTPGPGAAGADNPPNCTLPYEHVNALIVALAANSTAKSGPTNLDYGDDATYGANGSITLNTATYAAYNALGVQGAVVSYGTVGIL